MFGESFDHFHMCGMEQPVFGRPMDEFDRISRGLFASRLVEFVWIEVHHAFCEPFMDCFNQI
jgi:hypothetical protein